MAHYDVVMTGVSGNLGRVLVPALAAQGVRVCALREFGPTDTARWLVHLANIHAHPSANVKLLRDTLAAVAGRVEGRVVFGSFVTLLGCGNFDPTRFNCGKKPWLAGIYAVGKLLLEEAVVDSRVPCVMVYLPAVDTGPDSPWARMLTQAKTHGYVLPQWLRAEARPNHVTLVGLTDWLVARVAVPAPLALERVVLNTPAVRDLTWPALLGEKRLTGGPLEARWVLREGRYLVQNMLLAGLYWSGLFRPLWWGLRGEVAPARIPTPPMGPLPMTPLRLDGESGIQTAVQPFLST